MRGGLCAGRQPKNAHCPARADPSAPGASPLRAWRGGGLARPAPLRAPAAPAGFLHHRLLSTRQVRGRQPAQSGQQRRANRTSPAQRSQGQQQEQQPTDGPKAAADGHAAMAAPPDRSGRHAAVRQLAGVQAGATAGRARHPNDAAWPLGARPSAAPPFLSTPETTRQRACARPIPPPPPSQSRWATSCRR
jgi:hypothetical protein